ncbi:hypothetical protein LINGRAHAP2_LOCUS14903 [Linum grandiflorum]
MLLLLLTRVHELGNRRSELPWPVLVFTQTMLRGICTS